MLAKDLKVGEFGIIISSYKKGIIVKRTSDNKLFMIDDKIGDYWNNIYDLNIEIEKLENVKITYDGCAETDSDRFEERVMWVWESDENLKIKRVVFMKRNGKFLAWNHSENLNVSKTEISTTPWNYAKEIEKEELVHLTLEDISNGKGVGVNPELIRIKK